MDTANYSVFIAIFIVYNCASELYPLIFTVIIRFQSEFNAKPTVRISCCIKQSSLVQRMYCIIVQEFRVFLTIPSTIVTACIYKFQFLVCFIVGEEYILRTFNSNPVSFFLLYDLPFDLFLCIRKILYHIVQLINLHYIRYLESVYALNTASYTLHQSVYRLCHISRQYEYQSRRHKHTDKYRYTYDMEYSISHSIHRILFHESTQDP